MIEAGLVSSNSLRKMIEAANATAAGRPANLMFLAKRGDVAGVASALRNPLTEPNSSGSSDDSDTPLIVSVVKGHIGVTALLLADKRVDPNAANEHGITPLMLSACQGHASVLTLLLSNERIDPNMADRNGVTCLMTACRMGSASLVALLLADVRVDPNITTNDNWTALMIAAQNGHAMVVSVLLDDARVEHTNVPTLGGETALGGALRKGYAAVAQFLLADHRTTRTRPAEDASNNARATYDAALRAVKYPRRARFKGLVRAVVVFGRMRLRAAEAVYAPGGAGFMAAAASFRFNAAAATTTVAVLGSGDESG